MLLNFLPQMFNNTDNVQDMDKTIETLQNIEIKLFVLAALEEHLF